MIIDSMVYKSLQSFDLTEYVIAARRYGRRKLKPGIRLQAAVLYEEISRNSASNVTNSVDETALLEFAQSVLFAEWYFHNNTVPRYVSYTNLHVLEWVLRSETQNPLVSNDLTATYSAIKCLLLDLRNFEERSLAKKDPGRSKKLSEQDVERRVDLISDLLVDNHQLASDETEYLAGDEAPDDWESYLSDSTRTMALRHLTCFPQTNFHDEVLFLRMVHMCECVFRGVGATTAQATESITAGHFARALARLTEAVTLAELLLPLFRILKTMPPEHFLDFRVATGNASAVQSRAYQLMEIRVEGFRNEKSDVLRESAELSDLLSPENRNALGLKPAMRQSEPAVGSRVEWAALVDATQALDKALYSWRALHLGVARNYLPTDIEGTGGTSGVSYLETHLGEKPNLV